MRSYRLYTGIFVMVLSAACTAVGQALWKIADHGVYSWQLYLGFMCYGAGALLMTLAFRYGSLSVLHPLLSVGYVFSILIGVKFIHETVTWYQVVGDVVIVMGAVFMGLGGRREQMSK